ncbi:MAG: hypothetical protein IJU05_03315 [Schwartzia sp.]|nr:hypothetical protein [Schwartzia sp. (in: firmicutes)]
MNALKGVFLYKLPVKLVALFAACVLWAFVMNEQNPSMEGGFSVPITIQNSPAETVVTQSTEGVRVKLRGPRSAFAAAEAEEFKAYINLEGLTPGEHSLRVQTNTPQGFEVVSVVPDMVTVNLDPIVDKRMPIRLSRRGASPPGMTVDSIKPDTTMVTLVGPQSAVARVDEVVGVVQIPRATAGDADVEVTLMAESADDQPIEGVRVVPQVILARIGFAPGISRKIFDIKPVFEGVVGEGYAVTGVKVEPSRIEAAGTSTSLAVISALDTEAISVSELTSTTKRTVRLVLPEGVTVADRNVVVTIQIERK